MIDMWKCMNIGNTKNTSSLSVALRLLIHQESNILANCEVSESYSTCAIYNSNDNTPIYNERYIVL